MLPLLLATSVVRGSQQGESHGGIYLVNMTDKSIQQKFDWNSRKIDFSGRGADRGLRGIAYYQEQIYIAASDEIFIFEQDFTIITSIKNLFLKHCHEICIWRQILYITSTGCDAILCYDLKKQKFIQGIHVRQSAQGYRVLQFDPTTSVGPKASNNIHINSVSCDENGVCFSGRKAPYLFKLQGNKFGALAKIPLGTHNAQPCKEGIIYNDTEADTVCLVQGQTVKRSAVPTYPRDEILNIDKYLTSVARPSFGRGMAVVNPNLIVAGSSPSTIALHDMEKARVVETLTISMDVRNAIHGLAVWPF